MRKNLAWIGVSAALAFVVAAGTAFAGPGHDHGTKTEKTEAKKADAKKTEAKKADVKVVKLDVKGMTCDNCAAKIQGALAKMDGVEYVKVSYADNMAKVKTTAKGPNAEAIVAAIEKTGFEATVRPMYMMVNLDVEGMTCNGCAGKIHKALTQLEGVEEAEVSYASKGAVVKVAAEGPNTAALVAAVESAGFKAKEAKPAAKKAESKTENVKAEKAEEK